MNVYNDISLMGFSEGANVVVALDISGSTQGIQAYFAEVLRIYETLHGCNVRIILWNNISIEKNEKHLLDVIKNASGYGGTKPQSFLKMDINYNETHLVLITDGEIYKPDVDECNTIMLSQNIIYKSVTCYIIPRKPVNMSVVAPFMSEKWPFAVYLYEKSKMNMIAELRLEEFDELFINPDIDFVYKRLKAIASAAIMGKPYKLVIVRDLINKIFNKLKYANRVDASMLEAEFAKTKTIPIELAQDFCYSYSLHDFASIERMRNELLTICDRSNNTDYYASAVQLSSDERLTKTVEGSELTEDACTADTEIEGPITYILGSPLLPLRFIKLVLERKNVQSFMSNTFYAKKLEGLEKMFDVPITYNEHVELIKRSDKSAFTRETIVSYLTFGENDESVKINNNAIAIALFGTNKIIGNLDIWFYIIYLAAKKVGERLAELIPLFEAQLRYRMANSTCNISLTGYGNTIQATATFGLALRFVISQLEINLPKAQSSLPTFAPHLPDIVKLLELYGATISKPVKMYATAFEALHYLLKDIKRADVSIDAFASKWRAVYYKYYKINRANVKHYTNFHEYVLLDGPQDEKPKHAVVGHVLYYNLAMLIVKGNTKNLKVSDFIDKIPYSSIEEYYKKPVLQICWPLYYKFNFDTPYTITICPATLRPYSTDWAVEHEKVFNSDGHIAEKIFEDDRSPTGHVFCCTKMYSDFVKQFMAYPTLDEFILYCYNRTLTKKYGHITLPNIEFCIRTLGRYEPFTKYPVDKFLKIYESSVRMQDRVRMESEFLNE
jgi:hypothetical protein